MSRSERRWEEWWGFLVELKDEIRDDELPVVAAGLAFYAILAVFPALIALVSIYGLVADPAEVQHQVEAIFRLLPPGAASLVADQLNQIVASSPAGLGWAAALGVAGSVWTASNGARQIVRALNIAYDVEEGRGFLRLRGLALALTVGMVLLGGLALGAIAVVPPLLVRLGLAGPARAALAIGRWPLIGLVVVLAFAVLYRYGPDRIRPAWRQVAPGAVVATIVWLGASILFSWYTASFGRFNRTYGSLGAVIVLLLWLYLSAFSVLLGAEVNAIRARRRAPPAAAEGAR